VVFGTIAPFPGLWKVHFLMFPFPTQFVGIPMKHTFVKMFLCAWFAIMKVLPSMAVVIEEFPLVSQSAFPCSSACAY
jgi:hypothetical protein